MSHRRITDKQREWLERELGEWLQSKLLSPEQAQQIRGQYESSQIVEQRKRSLFSFTIMGVAALLVGLALFLLIGYNWDELSKTSKLLLIFGVILATHAAGLYLRFQTEARRLSEIVFFLGCLFYGAGIWLIAQVFHLDSHYPDGVWWWAVGVLPFALCLDTILLHLLCAWLLGIWVGMELIEFPNLGPALFWGWWQVPNGAYSLLPIAALGLLWAYRKGSSMAVGLYAALIGWWVVLLPIAWGMESQIIYLVGSVGAAFLIVAESHRRGNPLAIPHRVLGTLMTGGCLIPLTFYSFYRELYSETTSFYQRGWSEGLVGTVAILAVLSVSVALATYFHPRDVATTNESTTQRVLSLLKQQWVPIGMALLMVFSVLWSMIVGDNREMWLVPTVLANLAMVALAIWLMSVGLRDDRGRPFAAGVLYFLLWSILRYVDLFGEAGGMLGAAVMFFLCGAALFGLGMFWRGRKETQHA